MTRMEWHFIHSQGNGFNDTQLGENSSKTRRTATHGGHQNWKECWLGEGSNVRMAVREGGWCGEGCGVDKQQRGKGCCTLMAIARGGEKCRLPP